MHLNYSDGAMYSHTEWFIGETMAAPSFHSTGTFHYMRSSILEVPPLVSLLSWSGGGLVNRAGAISNINPIPKALAIVQQQSLKPSSCEGKGQRRDDSIYTRIPQ